MLHYALVSDTEKLTTGTDAVFSAEQLDKGARTLSLCCACGMPAAFQLFLCDSTPWALNVGNEHWISQDLRKVVRVEAPPQVTLQIEEMHRDNDGYFRADALLEQSVTEQDADQPRAVYAEILLPSETPAGEYSFNLRILCAELFADETLVGEVTVHLTVFPVMLPKPEEQKFYLDLWQHSCKIARAHEVPLWSDAHFALLEPYVRSLGELGQKTVTLVLSEAPWGGQSCFREHRMRANLYEYSILPVCKEEDGTLTVDFSVMQRYIDLCAKYGIRDELSVYGLMNVWCTPGTGFESLAPDDPDALRVRYYDKKEGCYRFLRTEAELESYIAQIAAYFRATGQLSRVRIAADEPTDVERYRASMQRLQRIEPDFRYKAAINHAEFIEAFGEEISDFVPYVCHLFTHLELLQSYRKTMPGKRFLWYTCCGPHWPNTFLRSNLCDALFFGVFTSWSRMDGYLRWAYTEWNDDPRTDGRYGDFANGDTHFVYPSLSGKPLYTLRWKALRKGIVLYELLERVRDRFGDAEADGLIGKVLFDTDTKAYYSDGHWADAVYAQDGASYETLLRCILEKLSCK